MPTTSTRHSVAVPDGIVQEALAAVKKCLNNFANFNGRSSVAEYWWFMLFVTILSAATYFNEYLQAVVGIVFIVPVLAVSWRRMHDLGKGGGFFFINLIPVVGQVVWIILCCREGEPGVNRFGERPRF